MRYENVGQRPKVLANRARGQVIFVLCFGCKVAVHWGAREIEVYYACQRVILVEAMILWLHSLLLRGSPVDLAAGHENSTSFGLCLTSRQRRKMWPCLRCVLPILRLLSIWATSREACGSEKLLAAAWGSQFITSRRGTSSHLFWPAPQYSRLNWVISNKTDVNNCPISRAASIQA